MANKPFSSNYGFLEGKTNLAGKMNGVDANVSKKQANDLRDFMNEHDLKGIFPEFDNQKHFFGTGAAITLDNFIDNSQGTPFYKEALAFRREFQGLISADIKPKEFKTRWLDFKARHDDFVERFRKGMGAKEEGKGFKEIHASGSMESYDGTDIKDYFFKNFIKAQKANGVDVVKILKAANVDKNV